jgi:predicted outer membrane repeat protein
LYTESWATYTATGCSITNNYASSRGGGICARGAVTVEDCSITDNESGGSGGGVSLYNSTIRACNISDNMSLGSGGGIHVLAFGIIEHTTITGNSASYSAGAIFSNASNLTLDHTTVCFNHASDCSGLRAVYSDVLLKDSIFAFDTPGAEISVESQSIVDITYCDIVGGPEQVQIDVGIVNWLVGNIFKDPLFCDQVPLLEDCSPCLGAGSGGSNIGRGAAGCPCGDPTGVGEDETETTWGRIKQMFR